MNVYLDPEDHRMLKIEAIERGATLGDLAATIMNEGVAKLKLEREARQRRDTALTSDSTNLVSGETPPQ